MMKVAVACGGTGGHFFPGLATAEELVRSGHDVTLWLAGKNVESLLLNRWTGKKVMVKASGFQDRNAFRVLRTILMLVSSFLTSRRIMKKDRPDVLLAMGGYGSVGPCLAAKTLHIPFVLHEANAIPGRAIRFLAPWASCIALGFQSAEKYFPNSRTSFTGFPLRQMERGRLDQGALQNGLLTILVMGGSQGARALNTLVPDALLLLKQAGVAFQVIHLTGRADEDVVRKRYQESGILHAVYGFLQDMGKAYSMADLAVSRSGAAACAELAAFSIPAILIPFPFARDQHQSANAADVEAAGGAVRMEERDLTATSLLNWLQGRLADSQALQAMKAAMARYAISDGAGRLAKLVVDCVENPVNTAR